MEPNKALSNEAFQKQLAFGQIAETAIAKWLLSKHRIILPIYDIEYDTGKGPRLFQLSGNLIAPDLLVLHDGQISWIEAKHKSNFAWYRKGKIWTTGIDLHHYSQYLKVQEATHFPVWLLFFHKDNIPSKIDRKFAGCPLECPTGLFGNSLEYLSNNENHRFADYGKSGMVYWDKESLRLLATLEEMQQYL